jgi:hypothetical protein
VARRKPAGVVASKGRLSVGGGEFVKNQASSLRNGADAILMPLAAILALLDSRAGGNTKPPARRNRDPVRGCGVHLQHSFHILLTARAALRVRV